MKDRNIQKPAEFGFSFNRFARFSVLGTSALILAACASQPKEVDAEVADAEAQVEAQVETAQTAKVEQVAKPVVEAVEQVQAEPAAPKVAPAAALAPEVPKPVAKAKPVEKVVEKAEPVAEVAAPESVEEKVDASAQADQLVASLAAKDKFAVIKEEPAPEPTDTAATAQEANVAKAKPKSRGLVQKALNVKRSDLPVTIELWTIKKSTLPGDNELIITTPTWEAGSGNYLSQIWLTLRDNQLEVHSSSDIDPSIPGSGIKVNGGSLEKFDRIEGNKIAVLDGDYMSRLAEGGSLEVMLGFFPDKAKRSPLFKTKATLDALSRLVPTYDKLK